MCNTQTAPFSSPLTAGTITTQQVNTDLAGVPMTANNDVMRVYPNPVTNRSITIEIPAATGNWDYELVKCSG